MSSRVIGDDVDKFLRSGQKNLIREVGKEGKKKVWIVDERDGVNEGFLSATVLNQKDENLVVELADGKKIEVHVDNTEQMNPSKFDKVEDIAELTYLNEASVLHNLKERYQSNLIYTYSGLFCVTINPYKFFPIYSDKVVQMYKGKKRNEMPPHIYGITDQAYQQVLRNKENQSILITGESGAGKTENTKKVIQYFASVAGSAHKKAEEANLEQKVIEANPVLEAFGNARTIRNDNSSRFGKFIRIHFNNAGKIAGADIEYYLLEKSRVILQQPGERAYHIFYQLLKCAEKTPMKDFLKVKDPLEYTFLSKGISKVDSINDMNEFESTLSALDTLGFTEEERDSLFQVLTAILLFGNVKCQQRRNEEQASFTQDSFQLTDRVGHLLGIKAEDLKKSLLKPRIKVGNEWVYQGRSAEQVESSIGALSMSLYERMFKWIVGKINQTLDTKVTKNFFIGVLDIAGFEIFAMNSFEQLCINYTNEKLQQFFNHHMFIVEQEEYKKENIDWTFIDFGLDLQSCIDLIEKPMGLLSLLDEECLFPKASDKSYVEKIVTQHEGKSPNFAKCKFSGNQRSHFEIAHYAGLVPYTVREWLIKNKDPVNESVVELFKKSNETLISTIYTDFIAVSDVTGPTKQKKGSKFTTVAQNHKLSLGKLLDNLYNTQPHFVRCIIPNEMKKPGIIDAQLVLHQLRCNGVLEGIRICRRGFPNRMPFEDFRHRYGILAPYAIPAGFMDGRKVSQSLIAALELEENEFRIGNSKVFFRAGVLGRLEELRDQKLSKIIFSLQAFCRGYLMRRNYQKMQNQKLAIIVLQKNLKSHLFLRTWPWWRLYTKVKPILKVSRTEEDLKKQENEIEKLREKLKTVETEMEEMQDRNLSLIENNQNTISELRREQEVITELEDKNEKLESKRKELLDEIQDLETRLENEEEDNAKISTAKRKLEVELDRASAQIGEIQQEIKNLEDEKVLREQDLNEMTEEMEQLREQIGRLQKDKKNIEDNYYEASNNLQKQEDKNNQLTRSKQKLENQLIETQEQLTQEKLTRGELEKNKRRVEQDLRALQQDFENITGERSDMKNQLQKKENDLTNNMNNLEEYQNVNSNLQLKIKNLESQIEELDDDLEQEKMNFKKVDKQKSDLYRDLEELEEKLDLQGGMTSVQVDLNRKREQEFKSVQRELEESRVEHERIVGDLKRNHMTQVQEFERSMEQMRKSKSKSDKDFDSTQDDLTEMKNQLEKTLKAKTTAEKSCRQLEDRMAEVSAKNSDLESSADESRTANAKLINELNSVGSELESAESILNQLTKNRHINETQIEELRTALEEANISRAELGNTLKLTETELEQTQEQMDEELDHKEDLIKFLNKERQEGAYWKQKYENEALRMIEDLEEQRRRLTLKLNEMQDLVNGWENKASALEKTKSRLTNDIEDLHVQMEKAQAHNANLEKKQRKVDIQFADWKQKFEKKEDECQEVTKEARFYNTEYLKLKTSYEEFENYVEVLKRENMTLSDEIKGLQEQASERGMTKYDLQKNNKRLETDRTELMEQLDELDSSLMLEQGKLLKLQLEITQYKQEVERKLSEKEDEFENLRKTHQKQLTMLKHSLEEESRSKHDQAKLKKGIETKILELEEQTEYYKKMSTDQGKQLKKSQNQVREITLSLEEEKKVNEERQLNILRAEKKCMDLQSEIEHIKAFITQAERVKRSADSDISELSSELEGVRTTINSLQMQKRKLEEEKADLDEEIEELETSAREATEKYQNAMEKLTRQSAENLQLREHVQTMEKQKAHSDRQLRELNAQLEEATESAAKLQKRQIAKLEEKIREFETTLDIEMKSKKEISKNAKKMERRNRDLQNQLEEELGASHRTEEQLALVSKKYKSTKQEHDELLAEVENVKQKYRKSRQEIEELEEQLSTEQSLRARPTGSNWNSPQKNRGAVYQRPGTGSSGFVSERGGGNLMDSFKMRDESMLGDDSDEERD